MKNEIPNECSQWDEKNSVDDVGCHCGTHQLLSLLALVKISWRPNDAKNCSKFDICLTCLFSFIRGLVPFTQLVKVRRVREPFIYVLAEFVR